MTPKLRATLRNIDRRFEVVRAMPELIAEGERHRHTIDQAGHHAYLKFAGDTWRVEEVSHYQDKKSRWWELELFALKSGSTRYLEWERDDGIEVSFNGPRFSLRTLGVTADQVEAMSEGDEGTLTHDGRSFEYDDDYPATYHKAGAADGDKVHFYDFETVDERHCLTVEEWGDVDEGYNYEVYSSEYLDPDSIEVLCSGKGAPR